jgi:hypothetical protein
MSDDAHYGTGVAMAAMHLQVIVFAALLRSGTVTPKHVRFALDELMLRYEEGHGMAVPGLPVVATYAREQVQYLLETLEATSPEMKANPPEA